MLACRKPQNIEIVQDLVDAGVDIDKMTEIGLTALRQAIQHGNNKAAKILVEKSATIVYTDAKTAKYSPLFYAIQMDNAAIIEFFCDTNIDLGIKNEEGNTPLMYAAYNGYNETVNHLTLRTKNLDTEDKQGNTLMMIYLKNKDHEMLNKLLSRGASINFRNRFGITPLLYAVK